jgi:hypothetical protein
MMIEVFFEVPSWVFSLCFTSAGDTLACLLSKPIDGLCFQPAPQRMFVTNNTIDAFCHLAWLLF